jgi:tetratricopeptide (TPR) repeat protein
LNWIREFALAYFTLGHLSRFSHVLVSLMTAAHDRVRKCKEAIDTAIRLDPELPEIHMALGQYYYWCLLDYQKALEEFSIAEKRFRNHPECIFLQAAVYRRAGDWESARENFLLHTSLIPDQHNIAQNTAATFFLLGEFTSI